MENYFRQEQLDIVCISDNVKYFVFEGPNFVQKEKKDKKGKKGEKKEEEVKKNTGLLGGLLDAKASAENEEKKKKDKAQRVLYVFKLEKVMTGIFAKKLTWKFTE